MQVNAIDFHLSGLIEIDEFAFFFKFVLTLYKLQTLLQIATIGKEKILLEEIFKWRTRLGDLSIQRMEFKIFKYLKYNGPVLELRLESKWLTPSRRNPFKSLQNFNLLVRPGFFGRRMFEHSYEFS